MARKGADTVHGKWREDVELKAAMRRKKKKRERLLRRARDYIHRLLGRARADGNLGDNNDDIGAERDCSAERGIGDARAKS